jgi:dihydrofolate synthase/folylpolyglutamate synthase
MNSKGKGYKEAVTHLYGLQKYGIKFGLSKTSNLLRNLDNPHNGQKYIHIGGTNGKGSVAAFVASILKETGLKVGLYTSPHLVRFTERFKINHVEITREKAADLIHELTDIFVPEEPPTFFEATTAMALVYFARENTDISMEHQLFLGSRLLDIAGEKGGIIKEGVDVVTAVTQPSVIRLFESICADKKSRMWRLGKDIRCRTTGSGLHYRGINRHLKGLNLGLKGKFQSRNGALALAVIELLEEKGFKVSSQDIREGLKKSIWPGRMQVVAKNPTIILDGAHNPKAMKALADSIKTDFRFRRMILVIGVMEDKEIGQILRRIVPLSDYMIYTRPIYYRAARPEILMAEGARLGKTGEIVSVLTEAIEKAKDMADPQDLIVITGSLFTVGEAMTYFDPETYRSDDLD